MKQVSRRTTHSSPEASVLIPRVDLNIRASVSPERQEFVIIGKGAEASFVQAKTHQRNKRKRYKQRVAQECPVARAARDIVIPPQSCTAVPILLLWKDQSSWFLEKTVLGQSDGTCLITTPCLLSAEEPRLPVSNPSNCMYIIRKGENLGRAHKPAEHFEKPLLELDKHTEGVKSLIAETLNREAAAPDASKEEELWGPKTTESVDPTIYPSEELESILDIGPEWPEAERVALLDVLRKRINMFGFDGRLGHNESEKFNIHLQPNTKPIATPMYAASPAKREVIDQQTDEWLLKEVIEPSRSPWSAPVVIVYRNGKARFCVDYRKLNAATIPDVFHIPRQSDILQALSGAQVLSSLDVLSGFTQITIAEEDHEKTAFRSHRGLFQF